MAIPTWAVLASLAVILFGLTITEVTVRNKLKAITTGLAALALIVLVCAFCMYAAFVPFARLVESLS